MITLIGGEKGGTGKSTLATNLATWLAQAGRDVLLMDTDRQGTSANWASERQQQPLPRVHCVQRFGNVFQDVLDLSGRYDEIVIDAGGRDSEELRSAMVAANLLCFRPSQSDLWTAAHLADLVKMARAMNPKLTARTLLSIAPTNPRINEAAEASELLSEFDGLDRCSTVIRERKAYRDALCEGRGVIETRDAKAAEELNALAREIYGEQVQSDADQAA